MADAVQRALKDAIESRTFAPAYYLYGEDDFLKDDAVKQLVAAAVDPATRDFNLDVRRGADLDGEMLETLLGTAPMMAERRAVVIHDVASTKKDVRAALERYLARPAPQTVVLLVDAAGAKVDKKLESLCLALDFRPLSGNRLPKWIAHHANTVHGVEVTPGAIALLESTVGRDLSQLASELAKLASYSAGGTVDEDAVAAIVGVQRTETMGTLLDRIAARDARGALELVGFILSQPKVSGVQIVMALATQTLAIAWGTARLGQGLPRSALSKEYYDLLKATGAYPARPWGEAVTAWVRATGTGTLPALDRSLAALLVADIALKESRVSSEEQVIVSLVLSMCTAEGQAAA